jgi:hypothetical protein
MKEGIIFLSTWAGQMNLGMIEACKENGFKVGGYVTKEGLEYVNNRYKDIKVVQKKDCEEDSAAYTLNCDLAKYTLLFDLTSDSNDNVFDKTTVNPTHYNSVIKDYLKDYKESGKPIIVCLAGRSDKDSSNDEGVSGEYSYGYGLMNKLLLDALE